jgi:ubiquinone/menaquinone biosynthesis C-methylase UbiE
MKKQNLSEGSKSYHEEANIYERFSQVEDTPKKILKFLTSKVKNKKVLDLGCGTGKYLVDLAPISKKYIGLDISIDQLKIAKEKSLKLKNVKFLCSSAEFIDLPNKSVDVIISTWVLGTIVEDDRRLKALKEMKRILKKDGEIYLVENDIGGEFEIIRNRFPNTDKTKKYNDWLENKGFIIVKKIKSFFEFDSIKEAKEVFTSIWGEKVRNKIKNKKIEHKIVIYKLS